MEKKKKKSRERERDTDTCSVVVYTHRRQTRAQKAEEEEEEEEEEDEDDAVRRRDTDERREGEERRRRERKKTGRGGRRRRKKEEGERGELVRRKLGPLGGLESAGRDTHTKLRRQRLPLHRHRTGRCCCCRRRGGWVHQPHGVVPAEVGDGGGGRLHRQRLEWEGHGGGVRVLLAGVDRGQRGRGHWRVRGRVNEGQGFMQLHAEE